MLFFLGGRTGSRRAFSAFLSLGILLLAACGGGGGVFSAPAGGGSSGGSGGGLVVTPSLASVQPASGPSGGGTAVTITGSDFVSGATVRFGAHSVTPISVTSTTILVFTPAHDPGPTPGPMFNAFTYDPPAGQSVLFTNVTRAAGITFKHTRDTVELPVSAGLAIADFNNDGWDDFYLTNAGGSNALYLNQQDGTFVDQAALAGVDLPASIDNAGCAADFDNDGDPDLYVINDFGELIQPDVLVRDDGPHLSLPWTFTDVSLGSGADVAHFGMGLAIGDYDLDGWFDFYTTDIGRNELLRNNGDGSFTDTTDSAGVGRGSIPQTGQDNIGWGAFFFDFDNDGDEDLYAVAGGMADFIGSSADVQPSVLFRNDGNGAFTDISSGSGANNPGRGRAGAYFDFDRDGDLDILVSRYNQTPLLLRNDQTTGNAWLIVRLRGTASNRDGIGARIRLTAGGLTQIREVRSGSSHCANNMLAVHFGLGAVTTVGQLEIR